MDTKEFIHVFDKLRRFMDIHSRGTAEEISFSEYNGQFYLVGTNGYESEYGSDAHHERHEVTVPGDFFERIDEYTGALLIERHLERELKAEQARKNQEERDLAELQRLQEKYNAK
jgi:hypothetical protein